MLRIQRPLSLLSRINIIDKNMSQPALDIIKASSVLPDHDINLAKCALAVAAIDSPNISLGRFEHHIQTLIDEVALEYAALLEAGADDDAATQLAALKRIICDRHEYEGDETSYDDLQNVNLMRVIERRKGMPVTLSLLYIHVGLAQQGWKVEALSFPAHVVCRIEKEGERILFDPFNGCKILHAPDLRHLLKTLVGPQAELSSDYYDPATKRELLIRMQNNAKLRQVEGEDYLGALKTVEVMRLLDPNEYRLLFDAGVLYARTHQVMAAVDALESYIDLAPQHEDCHDALVLLRQIKESFN